MFPGRQGILLDWLAFNVQYPGEKILYAVVLEGSQGTGKSLFGYVMKRLLGSHNVNSSTNETLHEPFTNWAKHCQLVIVEELMGYKRQELMNKLKPFITEPTVQIRDMYRPAYAQPNRFNFFAFTNHKDAIQLTKDDRRYCLLKKTTEKRPDSYIRKLWKWVKKPENLSAMLYELEHRDLSCFDRYADAPMTEEKAALIEASAPKLQQWLKVRIEEVQHPCDTDFLCVSDLTGDVLPPDLRGYSLNAVAAILLELGAHYLGQIDCRANELGQRRIYAIRRQRFWTKQKKAAVAAEYARSHGLQLRVRNETLERKPM
jgi:hypothetical protein